MECSEGLVLSITAAAVAVSRELTQEQIAILAAAATQFGDTLATLAALKSE